MNIVAMIPARSGSKGLPDKNIKNLCGRPVMGYSIEAALGCTSINEVFVNSDSQKYLDLSVELGAQPFLRSTDLAQDNTSMGSVVGDFVDSLEKQGKFFDAVIVLYPIYPLRSSDDLITMIAEFKKLGGNRSLIGMKTPDTHPYLCYQINDNGVPTTVMGHDPNIYYRRQTYPEYFEITHWACIFSVKSLSMLNAQLMNENTYGYRIPDNARIVDIDTFEDFQYAEFLLQKNIET